MKFIACFLLLWIAAAPIMAISTEAPAPKPLEEVIETITPTTPSIPMEELETIPEPTTELILPDPTIPEPTLPQPAPIEQIELEWEEEAVYLAKTVWGEARGLSELEQEKVIWCVLNRVDSPNFPNTIKGVVTGGAFHGYSKSNPVWKEHYVLALEVIAKWLCEKEGGEIERALENDYFYFSASRDRTHHIFRKEF